MASEIAARNTLELIDAALRDVDAVRYAVPALLTSVSGLSLERYQNVLRTASSDMQDLAASVEALKGP